MNSSKLGTLFLTLALCVGCTSERPEFGAAEEQDGGGETNGTGGSAGAGRERNGGEAGAQTSGSGGEIDVDAGKSDHEGMSGSGGEIDDDAGTGGGDCDSPADCDDGVSCTDDLCNNGKCSNSIKSGSCRIDGACYNHNANDPDNSCRYCDTGISQTSWTNAASTKSCSDGEWCNGDEMCDGAGSCVANDARCSSLGAGLCALDTCDEANQRCFKPNTAVCKEYDESRCSAGNTCGASIESRHVKQYCDGQSAACDGRLDEGSWGVDEKCQLDQVCSGETPRCVSGGNTCSAVWCDDVADVCWQTAAAGVGFDTQSLAKSWCATRNWGGHSWRLPTILEWITAFRGCNSNTGMPTGEMSRAEVTAECGIAGCTTVDYFTCHAGDGPASDGCYWPEEFVGYNCNGLYFTSDKLSASGLPSLVWVGRITFFDTDYHSGKADALCVVDQ